MSEVCIDQEPLLRGQIVHLITKYICSRLVCQVVGFTFLRLPARPRTPSTTRRSVSHPSFRSASHKEKTLFYLTPESSSESSPNYPHYLRPTTPDIALVHLTPLRLLNLGFCSLSNRCHGSTSVTFGGVLLEQWKMGNLVVWSQQHGPFFSYFLGREPGSSYKSVLHTTI